MKQENKIPTKCEECYKTDFQLARPNCAYEIAHHLLKATKFFRDDLNMPLPFDERKMLGDLKARAQVCRNGIPQRSEKVLQEIRNRELEESVERQRKEMDEIKGNINEILKIVQNQQQAPILRETSTVSSPMREVRKTKPEIKVSIVKEEPVEGKRPHGGWKKYQRNVREDNVETFLEKLRDLHPELSDEIDVVLDGGESEAVKLTNNSVGNKMIEYRELE